MDERRRAAQIKYDTSEKGREKRKQWAESKKDHLKQYHSQWIKDNAKSVSAGIAKWRKENPEKFAAQVRRYYAENKEKIKAQKAVRKAVKTGQIIKPENCQHCGKTGRIDGHHPDYLKPLEVLWLCRQCHSDQHPRDVERRKFGCKAN